MLLQTEEEDVTLRGGEKMRVRLKLRGLQAGLLRVTGIHWQLEGAAFGYKALQLRQLPQPRSRYIAALCVPHRTCALTDPPSSPGSVILLS